MGASKRPNPSDSAESFGGVQLMIRLSISMWVCTADVSCCDTGVVSWAKMYRLSDHARNRLSAIFEATAVPCSRLRSYPAFPTANPETVSGDCSAKLTVESCATARCTSAALRTRAQNVILPIDISPLHKGCTC